MQTTTPCITRNKWRSPLQAPLVVLRSVGVGAAAGRARRQAGLRWVLCAGEPGFGGAAGQSTPLAGMRRGEQAGEPGHGRASASRSRMNGEARMPVSVGFGWGVREVEDINRSTCEVDPGAGLSERMRRRGVIDRIGRPRSGGLEMSTSLRALFSTWEFANSSCKPCRVACFG